MKTMGAAKFKEQCLAVLDALEPEGLIITKHGKPVAKVVPIRPSSRELLGCLRAKIRVRGNLLSTGARWEADAQP